METERTPPEFRMRLESRLLFAAALLAIFFTLMAGHNRAIAQEIQVDIATTGETAGHADGCADRRPLQEERERRPSAHGLSPLSCFTRNAFISPASLGEISPSTLRRCSGMCDTLSSSASKT